MGRKAAIEILLIEEADEKPEEDLEREISEDISAYPSSILWMKEVISVKVERI